MAGGELRRRPPAPTRRTATVEFVRGSVRGTRRRALATLPSLFTLGNMLCGFAAILVSIRGEYTLATVLIGLSVLFDITDGAVARLVGAVTPFGLQFDSLADLVSFGLAPALVAFTLFSQGRDQFDPLGWIVCFLWVACAATPPPTSGTSSGCPAPERRAWSSRRCSPSATRWRAATASGCCSSSPSPRC
jgi:CDP-diacylglycerol--serine O-phosphatidyltransferase